ncbi:MAG TPA: histidine ammonia-lyase [Anaerolineae bacterium]|nr:histidine ammonia-lyase [Anaerolineae bacterium]
MQSPDTLIALGEPLTLKDVVRVAREFAPVTLATSAREKVAASRAWVEKIVTQGKPIAYGINTGFGVFANVPINGAQERDLMRKLIISHVTGVGKPLAEEVVRATMLIRANALAQGYSGVRPIVIETLVEMLNRGVHPIIPEKGSVGASGDLAPLSHLALVLSTDDQGREDESGMALLRGELMSGKAAMEHAGIPRLILEAKEGLALNNGTSVSAALTVLAAVDARNLVEHSALAVAMTLEAVRGASNALDARIHDAAHHPGQKEIAARIRQLTSGSQLLNKAARVQDAYSIRCAPQVIGAAQDALEYASARLGEEINAATDNPLIFMQDGQGTVLSGGNFHGEAAAMAASFLAIAVSELGAISERRTFRMLDGKLNDGLPMMLVERGGLNSGLMMVQVTAAALASDNKTLAHPDILDSIPTSANQEDHVPMATNAARHLREIIWNTEQILAIELITAAQAIDLRLRNEGKGVEILGHGTRAAFLRLREEIPFLQEDRLLAPDLAAAARLVHQGDLLAVLD